MNLVDQLLAAAGRSRSPKKAAKKTTRKKTPRKRTGLSSAARIKNLRADGYTVRVHTLPDGTKVILKSKKKGPQKKAPARKRAPVRRKKAAKKTTRKAAKKTTRKAAKKTTRKKSTAKRSPAQVAATKKMLAANKRKRATKKR